MDYKKIINDIIPNKDLDEVINVISKFNFEGNKYNYLYCAYINQKIDLFKYLIKKGVSPLEKNDINEKITTFYQIIDNDDIEMFNYVLSNSEVVTKNINTFDNNMDFNPLLYSCFNSKFSFVKSLIEHGADINILNREKIFPLYDACKINNVDIVKLLIDKGANIYQSNIFNMTALGVAFVKDSDDCIEYLADAITDFSKLSDYTVVLLCTALKDDYKTYKAILSKLPKQDIIIQSTPVTISSNLAGERLDIILENLVYSNKIPEKYLAFLVCFENGETYNYIEPYEVLIKLAGVTYNNRQTTIKKLTLNEEVILKPEPNNPFDKTAVLVTNTRNEELGYIPRTDNKEIFNNLIKGQDYKAFVYSISSSIYHDTLGVNIKINFD